MKSWKSVMSLMAIYLCLSMSSGIVLASDVRHLIFGDFETTERNVRRSIGKDLSRMIDMLGAHLPQPKPSEIAWFKEEQAEIDKLKGTDSYYDRFINFHGSSEYQLIMLDNKIDVLLQILSKIVTEDNNIPEPNEMYLWAHISMIMTDKDFFDYALSLLIYGNKLSINNLKECNIPASSATGYGFHYNQIGRAIHEHIIIPYLARQMKFKMVPID
ncbi:MAG: hypothetical protein ACOWWM_16720 [Desulfobacterales bacterium]